MNKKIKSTHDEFIESLTPAELKKYKEGYREFALSELILAIIEQDEESIQKLAKIAGISPSTVESMRTGPKKDFTVKNFFKTLKVIGCKQFTFELNGHNIPVSFSDTKR